MTGGVVCVWWERRVCEEVSLGPRVAYEDTGDRTCLQERDLRDDSRVDGVEVDPVPLSAL